MNSQSIQPAIYARATSREFTAPYGVLTGKQSNHRGTQFETVIFGRARSLDYTVQIFNRHFITMTTNCHGNQVFRDYTDCRAFLDTL